MATEEELRARLRSLAIKMIDEAYEILEEGTPAARLQIVKTFGSHLVRALGSDDEDVLGDLRKDFMRLVEEQKAPRGHLRAVGETASDPN